MITILVATLNHPDLINRQLKYYADIGFKGAITIGDSSEGDLAKRTEDAVKRYQNRITANYLRCPNVHDAACMQQLLETVETPYVVRSGDDDFHIPAGLEKCVTFLEKNPDYTAVHGLGILAMVEPNGSGQKVLGTSYYKQQATEAESAAERLMHHYRNYAGTGFSLQRTESVRVMFKRAHEVVDRSFAGEALASCLSVVLGKFKELDCFYLVRQIHNNRHLLPSKFDWITSDNWLPSYRLYLENMSDEVSKKDNIPIAKAQEVVMQEFWGFLANTLQIQWNSKTGQSKVSERSGARRAIGRIPGAKSTWRAVKSRMPGQQNAVSLKALMRAGSPYHDEFMHTYRAMVEPL